MKYKFLTEGTTAENRTWSWNGIIESAGHGSLTGLIDTAIRMTFNQLTKGEAIYGSPGVRCDGPYTITKLLIERVGE